MKRRCRCPSRLNRRRLPGDKDDEGREDDRDENGIYNRKYTVLYNAEDNEEEASSGHEVKSSLSDSSDISDNKDDDDNITGYKDINCNGNVNI